MEAKKINGHIEEEIAKANQFWKEKKEMTKEQLEAVDEFAKKKSVFFKKMLNSPEKANEIEAMYQNALKES